MDIRNILDSLVNIITPGICGSCGKGAASYPLPICAACRDSLLYGAMGDRSLYYQNGPGKIYSLYPYHSAIKCCLHEFKFRGNRRILEIIDKITQPFLTSGKIPEDKPDAVIPVPLHPSRLYARGYNQSELISLIISKYLSIPSENRVLVKIRNTPPQTGLERPERLNNLKGAFRVLDHMAIAGKRLLLADDIMTTGTTMEECAGELLRKGALSVTGLTLARTL